MNSELTLEDRRTLVLRLFAAQETVSSVSRTDQSVSIGLLEEAWTAEGRPATEFVVWLIRGAEEAGGIALTKPVTYERRHAYAAIKAGIKVAQDGGTEIYSHLVHAGLRLRDGDTVAEVQVAADRSELKRKRGASTPGLSKILLPDTHLETLVLCCSRVRQAYEKAGFSLPENASATLAGLLDLIGSMADGVLELAARDAVGTVEKYVQQRLQGARMVRLEACTASDELIGRLQAVWGSDYAVQLDEAYPTWELALVFEGAALSNTFFREGL